MKLLLLLALVALWRSSNAVVPLGVSPLGVAPVGVAPVGLPHYGLGGLGYARPIAPVLRPAVAAPLVAKVAAPIDDYDPNPQYSYAYDIHDALTGDAKSQQETRSGDVVQGSYSLVEPDGTRRIVEYTADPHNGFNAVVHKEPAVAAAPVVAKVAAPIAYPGLAYH